MYALLSSAVSPVDEDDDLVELERIEQIVELAILLLLSQLHVVLLKTVKSQLRLVVDENLDGLNEPKQEQGRQAA